MKGSGRHILISQYNGATKTMTQASKSMAQDSENYLRNKRSALANLTDSELAESLIDPVKYLNGVFTMLEIKLAARERILKMAEDTRRFTHGLRDRAQLMHAVHDYPPQPSVDSSPTFPQGQVFSHYEDDQPVFKKS